MKQQEAQQKLETLPDSVFKYGLGIMTDFEADGIKSQPTEFECNIEGGAAIEKLYKAFESIPIDNKLLALNIAYLNSSIVIKAPAKTKSQVNLKLKSTEHDYAYIRIIAEPESEIMVIDDNEGKTDYRSQIVEIIAQENSQVRYATVQRLPDCKNYSYKKAVQARNSSVEWLEIASGSSLSKSETISYLKGEGSKATMHTVFFGSKEQQYDFLNKCNHIGRNTESSMLTNGALKGTSRAIQQGFAKIGKKAYGASTHQKAKILLLNEGPKAFPIPKLEIDNNDVVATHEASVGQIDADKLFYMMSRGFDKEAARKLYVGGFFQPFVEQLFVKKLREDIINLVSERMDND